MTLDDLVKENQQLQKQTSKQYKNNKVLSKKGIPVSKKLKQVKAAQPVQVRNHAQLNADYTELAKKLGDLEYRMKVMPEDIAAVVQQMREINQEAFVLQQAEQEAARVAASIPKQEPLNA